MMTVHLYQSDTNCKYSCTTCRDFIQLPLDGYGIYAIIDNQILKTTHDFLVHLTASDNGEKLDIGTFKKDRGDIFSECCAKSSKLKFLHYANEVLF